MNSIKDLHNIDILNSYNQLLSNKYVYIIIFLITTVLIGYTLQPVPLFLNYLFDNSVIFKFVIMFIVVSTYYFSKDNKLTNEDFMLSIFISTGLLIILEIFRFIEKRFIKSKEPKSTTSSPPPPQQSESKQVASKN